MYTEHPQLWGLILAGGDGQRLRPFVRRHFGVERPKQYCTFFGTESLLRLTLRRAERLIPAARVLTVVTQHHLPAVHDELADRPPDTLIVQPCDRGTGPGIFLSLLHIQQREPEAIVACLPAGHFIRGASRFMALVDAAATCVRQEPGRLVLLGAAPSGPEVDYGWIARGPEVGQVQGEPFQQVQRLWEKPTLRQAQRLLRQGALWHTRVLVGRVELLVTLFTVLARPLVEAFSPVRRVLGTPREAAVLADVYTTLRPVHVSQSILMGSTPRLTVVPLSGVYWSDWGNPQRLVDDLTRWGYALPASLGSHETRQAQPCAVACD